MVVARLEALRTAGAQRLDPARFHYMTRLARRLPMAHPAVRPILVDKLQRALADHGDRFHQAQQSARDAVVRLTAGQPALARELRRLFAAGDFQAVHRLDTPAAVQPAAAPLAALNHYIRQASRANMDGNPPDGAPDHHPDQREMKSVRRFRETWSRIAAERQVDQALVRGPENAGPLNSHMLVLRSLALMRDLSPDYLRRFMSQVDSLLWLEEESQKPAVAETKPTRRGRQKK